MSKFASFLAGMGGGYIKAKDKEYERERQAKDDAWREEQQGWQRADRAEKDALRTSMKDAFADRSTIEGTAVTGAGNKILERDPAQLAVMQKIQSDVADLEGTAPVTAAPATGVVSNATRGHQITTGPVDLTSLNSRDAKMARGVNALMAAGDPEKAISMENTVMENQAKKLGLNVAQLKFADDQFNRKMQETLSREGDFWGNASQVLTDTSLGGLAGVQVKPVVSADGKTVQMVGVKDGKEQVMFSAPNTAEGQLAFVQRISKADPATKIGWLKEGVDRESARSKAALDERRVAAVEQNANTNERKLDALLMRGAGAGSSSGRGAGTGSGASQPGGMPDPMANFDAKKAQATAQEIAAEELKGANASPQDIARRATAIYRGLESEFRGSGVTQAAATAFSNSSARARTQVELDAVFQKGLQAGFTPQQMASIDSRFSSFADGPQDASEPNKKGSTPPAPPQATQPKRTKIDPALELQILGHKMRQTGATMADVRRSEELQAEIAAKRGNEWWRGRASESNFGN